MKEPSYITCLRPIDYEPDTSLCPADYDVAVWIDKDYWLEEFDGKPNHVVVPSTSWHGEWGFEEQDDVTYWMPFEGPGDCMDWFDIDDKVLVNTLGEEHPYIKYEAPCVNEHNGQLTYYVSTLDLQLSDTVTNDEIWNILHATMRTKTYCYMRCLTITSPFYHPDYLCVPNRLDAEDAFLPVEQYAIALGLDPSRTKAEHCWRGG